MVVRRQRPADIWTTAVMLSTTRRPVQSCHSSTSHAVMYVQYYTMCLRKKLANLLRQAVYTGSLDKHGLILTILRM